MREKSGSFPIGKLSLDNINFLINKIRKIRDPSTFVGPGIGEDASIIRLSCCDLIVHSDPITEAEKGAGRLSIDIASNDIAVSGACPRWASVVILLPETSNISLVENIVSEISEEASRLGIDIIGGHTEVTPNLDRPIVITTVFGVTCPGCGLPTRNIKPGDVIVQIGYAGFEGSIILLNDFKELLINKCNIYDKIKEFNISIIKEACLLSEHGLVDAMHDATEGGLLGALVEMALASNLKIYIKRNNILVHPITKKITSCLNIDPLALISSGALLVATPNSKVDKLINIIKNNSKREIKIIGRVFELEKNEKPGVILEGDNDIMFYDKPPRDAISIVWEKWGRNHE